MKYILSLTVLQNQAYYAQIMLIGTVKFNTLKLSLT